MADTSAWLWAGKPRLEQFNITFAEWAPYNLQSIVWLRGDFRGFMDGRYRGNALHEYGATEHARTLRLLEDFDLVWPVDQFNRGMRLLSDILQLEPAAAELLEPKHTEMVSPRYGKLFGMPRTTSEKQDVCPNISACEAFIDQIAPYDGALYRATSTLFALQLKESHTFNESRTTLDHEVLAASPEHRLCKPFGHVAHIEAMLGGHEKVRANLSSASMPRALHMCGIPDEAQHPEDDTWEAAKRIGIAHRQQRATTADTLRDALLRTFGLGHNGMRGIVQSVQHAPPSSAPPRSGPTRK